MGAGFSPLNERAEQFVHATAHFVEFLRAQDQIDAGQFLEDRRAAALGHAAEEADDLVMTAVLAALQRAHLADGFLFRHVAHRAGVEQHHVGVILLFDQFVAAPRSGRARPARNRARSSDSRRF